MSHIQFVDELIREYLLFRGFGGALKAFDADLKIDKDKGFRVDKIVDQLLQHIYNYDLTGLRETWNHLDTRLFTRLEQHFSPSIRKLENAVLKLYLVNASENNKQDKITDFFSKLASDLVTQAEWKDWFVLPFIKNPEEHSVFSVYFTRQWQDSLLVSLHNFLAAVYQSMPQPTISSFEENASKMSSLQKENELIRKGLINLINDQEKVIGPEPSPTQGLEGIMDDFFNISQEIKTSENQAKLLKTIMKNIGSMPTSPKFDNKEPVVRVSHRKHSLKKVPQSKRSLSIDARPTHLKPRERDSSLDVMTSRASREASAKKEEIGVERLQEGNFLFLSREEYSEHKSHITYIKFNNRGNMVASADKEGVLKIWSISPSCKTEASFTNKSTISCLDWLPNHERYIICGSIIGSVSLIDIKETKLMWSINIDTESAIKKVKEIVASPIDPVALAIVSGKMYLLDLRTRKIEKCINIAGEASCVKLNHNGQLAIVGTEEGCVLLLDLRKTEVIEKWSCHRCSISQLEVTHDFTFVFTLAQDKLFCKSLNQAKSKGISITIPEEMNVYPDLHGRLFCLDNTGTLILTVGFNSGVIYKVSDSKSLIKSLELGGHKTLLTCVDWSFANQCATCVTASQDGKIKISTLLINSL